MNWPELKDAVLQLKSEGWQILTDLSSEEIIDKISQEIEEIFGKEGIIFEWREENIPKNLEIYIKFLDLVIVHLVDLVLIAAERNEENDLIWPNKYQKAPKNNLVLQLIITNIANSLIAFRRLVLTGLESQARIILRWFVEFSEVIIAILIDYNLYKTYINPIEDFEEAYKIWRKHFTFKKINKKLLGFEKEILSDDLLKELENIRKSNYKWLSQFTHANWIAQAVSAYALDCKTNRYYPCVGGMIDSKSKYTLLNACIHSFIFLKRLQYLFAIKHNWKKLIDDKERAFWMYRNRLIEVLFFKYYPIMLDNIDSSQDSSQ